MNERPEKHATRTIRRSLCCAFAVGTLSGLLSGCDRGESPNPADAAQPPEPTTATTTTLTALTFPTDVRAPHPEISAFLDEVLGTWLAGDYDGYRQFVSRAHTPQNRERFEAICQVTQAITVESIDPVDSPLLPSPAYRVVFNADLSEEHEARRGEKRRKLAIVVFKEVGQWRMATAPAEYQPQVEPPPATNSAPTASAPSYPWDEEGDY